MGKKICYPHSNTPTQISSQILKPLFCDVFWEALQFGATLGETSWTPLAIPNTLRKLQDFKQGFAMGFITLNPGWAYARQA